MPLFRISAVNEILGALADSIYLCEEEPAKTASGMLIYHISQTPTNLRLSDEGLRNNPRAFVGAKSDKRKKKGESTVRVPSDLVGCAQFIFSSSAYNENVKIAAVRMFGLLADLERSDSENPTVRHLCRAVDWFKPNLIGRFKTNAARSATFSQSREVARAILKQEGVVVPAQAPVKKPVEEKTDPDRSRLFCTGVPPVIGKVCTGLPHAFPRLTQTAFQPPD